MNKKFQFTGVALLLLSAACGGGGGKDPVTPTKDNGKPAPQQEVSAAAQDKFNAALDSFVEHDKANDWNDQTCADVAKQFDAAASAQGGKFAQATFNAGLAYQRCGDDKNAKAKFEQSLRDDPKLHGARAQLALYKYKQDQNEDGAINELQQAVIDAQFQNVPALVSLAMFQMQRDSDAGGQGC